MSDENSQKSPCTESERRYADIIHALPPVSVAHPPMRLEERAAQFAPFAALTGFEELLRETERKVLREKADPE